MSLRVHVLKLHCVRHVALRIGASIEGFNVEINIGASLARRTLGPTWAPIVYRCRPEAALVIVLDAASMAK